MDKSDQPNSSAVGRVVGGSPIPYRATDASGSKEPPQKQGTFQISDGHPFVADSRCFQIGHRFVADSLIVFSNGGLLIFQVKPSWAFSLRRPFHVPDVPDVRCSEEELREWLPKAEDIQALEGDLD